MEQNQLPYRKQKIDLQNFSLFLYQENPLQIMNQKKTSDPKQIFYWKEKTQMLPKEYYDVVKNIFNNCGATGNITRTNLIKSLTKMKKYRHDEQLCCSSSNKDRRVTVQTDENQCSK